MNLLEMWNNMEIGLMLGPQMLSQRLLSPTMLCSLATARLQGVMDVTDAYETQHLIHLLLHHMLLRHKECRVYKHRGETTIRITKTPEAVYYHPLSSCAPLASRNNINIEEGVLCKLVETNKQLLWRKFGIRFFRLGEILTPQTKYLLCFVSVSKIFIATHWYIVNDANILF